MDKRDYVNINEAINNSLKLCMTTIRNSKVDLILHMDENIPRIYGNMQNIEQILLNIVINAIEAIDHSVGKVNITSGHDPVKKSVFVSVSDNGVGIPADIAKNIFDPFLTNKQAEGGVGLGLAIAYNLVKEHNGNITFSSNNDKGTTFTITFPSAEALVL
jgi:signal transduction histidine kinase